MAVYEVPYVCSYPWGLPFGWSMWCTRTKGQFSLSVPLTQTRLNPINKPYPNPRENATRFWRTKKVVYVVYHIIKGKTAKC